MKGKKQILDEQTGNSDFNNDVFFDGDKDTIYASMDEYAKQLSIEYAHWLFKRLGLWHIEGDLPEVQAVNLFNVFIQEQSK